jgi:hypothetical protein
MTTTIIQLFGWKGDDIFDVLMSMSQNLIKTEIEELKHKYGIACTKPFIAYNKMTGQDLHDFYDEHSDKKKKPALDKSIENESTLDYIMFNLWDYIKIINDDHKLNLKVAILWHGSQRLYMYHDYLVTHELYHPGSLDFSFPSDLIGGMNLNPKPQIYTLIDGSSTEKESYGEYGLCTPPYSPPTTRYCDKCGNDC